MSLSARMSPHHHLVYATAESRLHADLMVVRLHQAGVHTDRISILYPQASRPNSALCWLNGSLKVRLTGGEKIAVSGPFRLALADGQGLAANASLATRLAQLGLAHDQGLDIEESLVENRIVVAVEVPHESDLPAIFRTLRGLDAEKIHTADIDGAAPKAGRAPAPTHAPALALSIATA